MPALIPGCIKRVEDGGDRIVLCNPVGGAEVRMNSWEARILPLIGAGPNAKAVAQAAAAAGVNMPVEHIQGLLARLGAAGLLVPEPEAPKPRPSAPGLPAPRPSAPKVPAARPSAPKGEPRRAGARGDATELFPAHKSAQPGHTPTPSYQEDKNERFSEKLAAPLPSQLTAPPQAVVGGSAGSLPIEDLRQKEPPAPAAPAPSGHPHTRTEHAVGPGPAAATVRPTTSLRATSRKEALARAVPDQPVTRTSPALPLGAVAAPAPRPAAEADPDGQPKRKRKKLELGWLPYALVVLPLLASTVVIPWPWGSLGPCTVEPLDARAVRLPVDVGVVRLLGEEGETINEGAVIALLDPARLKVDKAQTEAQIATQTADLEKVRKQRSPELERVRQAVDQRSGEMRVAYLEFRRLESLQQKKLATDAEVEAASSKIGSTRKALTDAQAELADTRTRVEDELRTREAELSRLRLNIKKLDELILKPEVISPITGTVAMRAPVPAEGGVVAANEPLVEIIQLEQLRAEGRFPQRSLGRVRVGAKVSVRFPGVERVYDSRVERVGSSIEVDHSERFLRVTAVIDNPHRLLRPKTRGTMQSEPDGESVFSALVSRLESLFD